ncbi:hypothetical protein [Patulibacter sp. SYSU D01012]|uniref:hypothetical protein n=1 Tax=Patulibacter sp. SYSU D01012 TaxID=2817381 RepID=UPI001B316B05|nr:hypothetical protein [Patulibacter sp. SYSU D01012]
MSRAAPSPTEAVVRRAGRPAAWLGVGLLALVAGWAIHTAVTFDAILAAAPVDERGNASRIEHAVVTAAIAGPAGTALLAARTAGLLRRPPGWAAAVAGALLGLGCLAAVLAVATLWV